MEESRLYALAMHQEKGLITLEADLFSVNSFLKLIQVDLEVY